MSHNAPAQDTPATADDQIAVIGIGCIYPGARDPAALWANVLARRQQFRRMPDVRLPLADYGSPDRKTPDKTYGQAAALIDGYRFDWMSLRIPRQVYEATDLAHWLALDVALQMLADAGYRAEDLPRETTQVVVGNTLTGEFTRSNTLRTRWPFVERSLRHSAQALDFPPATLEALVRGMEHSFKSPFPPVNEDTLAGGLANTIAGRICNFLNVQGGGYTVDGACSSSLIAVHTAATSLMNRQSDFAIAGGVDISLDPFELVGFAKTGALTPDRMSVYDRKGNGFIPGEGCGFVGLKRLADARRDGDKVYAVLDGWGMSSDGKGGITAPSVEGQKLSLQRAHRLAGLQPGMLDFIEGHGTGTALGDKTELLGISRALAGPGGEVLHPRGCGVTSFKSIVGHTKAAAGIGAFIKAVMAVNQRVIPPTAGCDAPHEVFNGPAGALYPVLRGDVSDPARSMRAGVSAMGFGGINVHVTLRSGDEPRRELTPAIGARAAMASHQDSELYALGAPSLEALALAVRQLQQQAQGASVAELADLAAQLNRQLVLGQPVRAAIVAGSVAELCQRAQQLQALIQTPPAPGRVRSDAEGQVLLGVQVAPARLGFLLPGQGSQRLNMARGLVQRFDWAAQLLAKADVWVAAQGTPGLAAAMHPNLDRLPLQAERAPLQAQLRQTELAQPAIVLASLLWLKWLDRLGLQPDVVLGHSLGELTAFHSAGAFGEETLMGLAALRGRLMAAQGDRPGAMLSLAADAQRTQQLLNQWSRSGGQGSAVIANRNGPLQSVLSGDAAAITALQALAQADGVAAQLLPVSNAFHSPLVADAAQQLARRAALPETPASWRCTLLSSSSGQPLQAPGLDLRAHFGAQIAGPVDFVASIASLEGQCDLALEVGPGHVLADLAVANGIAAARVRSVERHAESWQGLNTALALAHVHGRAPRLELLAEQRVIRQFSPASELDFIVNPCERPMDTLVQPPLPHTPGAVPASPSATLPEQLGNYLARRGRFLADVIRADMQTGGPAQQTVMAPTEAAVVTAAAAPVTALIPATTAPVAAPKAPMRALDVLLELCTAATGFVAAQIGPHMLLGDDLNLDSIKAASLIADACARLSIVQPVDGSELAALDLQAIANRLQPLIPAASGGAEAESEAAPTGRVLPLLRELVGHYTGFDAAAITPDLLLGDELNLDSIKLAALVTEAADRLGLTGQVQPSEAAADTLGALAQRLQALLPHAPLAAQAEAPAEAPADPPWVRSFAMTLVPADLPQPLPIPAWSGENVVIQRDASQHELARAVRTLLEQHGARVDEMDADALRESARQDIVHLIALLPGATSDSAVEPEQLAMAMARLATPAHAAARQSACRSLAYVQFDGLSDGLNTTRGDLQTCCATSFASSVHLERPQLQVTAANFSSRLAPAVVAEQLLGELAQPGSFGLSHRADDGRRFVSTPAVLDPRCEPLRGIDWSEQDVVLVSGGAKGVTAECALAFARATRACMALVGTSALPNDEVAGTLRRYADEGLRAAYWPCDIVDRQAVDRTLASIVQALGPVSGIIHGAGINHPRRVEQATLAEALHEVGPKVLGIANLLQATQALPLKLVIGLSSIIGVTGMPGNAWYAFSNEALDLLLQRHHARHAQTQVVALAYSVWSETGMGARMGSTKGLARMGIDAIPTQDGVRHFLDAVMHCVPAHQIVIASRLGGLDTWRATSSAPRGRFVQSLTSFEPGVELRARAELALDTDLYLRDHHYRGVFLFPTVFGLEAMAQATAALLGLRALGPLRIEDIGLERPIIVGRDAPTVLEIHAVAQERTSAAEPRRVRVGLRTGQTAFRRDHFSATFVLAEPQPAVSATADEIPAQRLTLDPQKELYGGLLFQGPLFQRMRAVRRMDDQGCCIEIERGEPEHCFSSEHDPWLVLGDPAFRDVLLQSVQLSEQGQYLPVRIAAIDMHAGAGTAPGLQLAVNRVLRRDGELLTCEVHAQTADGTPLETLHGYTLKRMHLDPQAPLPQDIVDPTVRDAALLEQALARACTEIGVSPQPSPVLVFDLRLAAMDKSRRRLSELPLFAEAVFRALPQAHRSQIAQMEVQWRDDGKPELFGLPQDGLHVSLSHDRSHCLCVAGTQPQGCDIEPVVPRSHAKWLSLLGATHEPLLDELVAQGDTLDSAGTRIWCALESLLKALGRRDLKLRVLQRAPGRVVMAPVGAASPDLLVLTMDLALTRRPQKMVALVLHRGGPPLALTAAAASATPRQATHRFRVTFKDTTTARHGLDFPVFANWMGALRELAVSDVGEPLVADFSTGQWGMVTNHSDIELLAPVRCMDLLEGRMVLSRAYGAHGSSLDMHFCWVRINADDREQLVARSNMAITWVRITGHGTVEVRPFPDYLQRLVEARLPQPGESGPETGWAVAPGTPASALGALLFKPTQGPRAQVLLCSRVFVTGSAVSNLVGNIYYATYYHWQRELIDQFLHEADAAGEVPALRSGELQCVRSEVRHLREAMPYDRIEVSMSLAALHERGVALQFEYHKLSPDGQRSKLAAGHHVAVWVSLEGGDASAELPEHFRQVMEATT